MRLGHVPELYWKAEWDKVRQPGIREWCRTLEVRTARPSDGSTLNWRLLGRGLMLLGGVGTGKSSAAGLICLEAAKLRRTLRWAYAPTLLDELLEWRARPQLMRELAAVDLLVLDDFGVRALTDWEVGYLDEIVERRYHARRPMVVTANLTVHDLRSDERWARMVDRWRERTAADVIATGAVSRRG
jgi:DNA replication protein DnaC